MANNRTTYKFTSYKELRHGHTFASAENPNKMQWHRADAYHRADPDAHTRCHSFEPDSPYVDWSSQSVWLTIIERAQLILKARAAHDDVAVGAARVASWRDEEPARTTSDDIYQQVSTEGTGDEEIDAILEVLKPYLSRITEVEHVTSKLADDLDEQRNVTSRYDELPEALERVDARYNELAEAHNDLTAARDELKRAAEEKRQLVITLAAPGRPQVTIPADSQHFKFPTLLAICRGCGGR